MKHILFVGGCGSGKTWVMTKLLKTLPDVFTGCCGMIKYHRNDKVLIPGMFDGSLFQGTDRLSMACMIDVEVLLAFCKKKSLTIVVEGDRFMNSTFLRKARPFVVKILDDGNKGRALRGSKQTERQIKSVATRVRNVKENISVKSSKEALALLKNLIKGNGV